MDLNHTFTFCYICIIYIMLPMKTTMYILQHIFIYVETPKKYFGNTCAYRNTLNYICDFQNPVTCGELY